MISAPEGLGQREPSRDGYNTRFPDGWCGLPRYDFGTGEALVEQKRAIESHVTHMYVCEIAHLILHTDQLYMFHKHPSCEACSNYHGEWRSV